MAGWLRGVVVLILLARFVGMRSADRLRTPTPIALP
jgi:hypothetical protein